MKLSFPITVATDSIEIPDPEIRDQATVTIGTTFKRMVDGSIIPFNHTPQKVRIDMIIKQLKYKQARLLIDFLLKSNNQPILFEPTDNPNLELFKYTPTIGTVISEPLALITTNSIFKELSLSIVIQQTVGLQPKHLGLSAGTQNKDDNNHTSFFLMGGLPSATYESQFNTEYIHFEGTPGIWVERNNQLEHSSSASTSFTLEYIYIVGGLSTPSIAFPVATAINNVNRYEPIYNSDGIWTYQIANIGVARRDSYAYSLNGLGYVGGGFSIDNFLISCVEVYNEETKSWLNDTGGGCIGLASSSTFVNEGNAYIQVGIIGGLSDLLVKHDGVVYSNWMTNPFLEVSDAAAGNLKGTDTGLLFGGTTTVKSSATYIIDVVTKILFLGSPLISESSRLSSAVLGNNVYAVGGDSNLGGLNSNLMYDRGTLAWAAKAVIPNRVNSDAEEVYSATSPSSNKGGIPIPLDYTTPAIIPISYTQVVVLGDHFGPAPEVSVWSFGSIIASVPIPGGAITAQIASIGGNVFIIDGRDGSSTQSNVERFMQRTIDGTWLNLGIGGNQYDAQPRDNSTRKIRDKGFSTSVGDSIFIMNGRTNDKSIGLSVDKWNPEEGWIANISNRTEEQSRYYNSGAVLQQVLTDPEGGSLVLADSIFCVAGYDKNNLRTATVTKYVVQFNTTSTITNAGIPVIWGGTINLDGVLYAFSGSTGTFGLKYVVAYDEILDQWNNVSVVGTGDTSRSAYGYSQTPVNDIGAFFGGILPGFVGTSAIWTFSADSSTWALDSAVMPTSALGSIAAPIVDTRTPTITDKILFKQSVTNIHVYSPSNNTYVNEVNSYNVSSVWDSVTTIGSRVYVIGTEKGNSSLYDVLIFDTVTLEYARDTLPPFNTLESEAVLGMVTCEDGVDVIMADGGTNSGFIGLAIFYTNVLFKFETDTKTHVLGSTVFTTENRGRYRGAGDRTATHLYVHGGVKIIVTEQPFGLSDGSSSNQAITKTGWHYSVDLTDPWASNTISTLKEDAVNLGDHLYVCATPYNVIISSGEKENDVIRSYDRGSEVYATVKEAPAMQDVAGDLTTDLGEEIIFFNAGSVFTGLSDPYTYVGGGSYTYTVYVPAETIYENKKVMYKYQVVLEVLTILGVPTLDVYGGSGIHSFKTGESTATKF